MSLETIKQPIKANNLIQEFTSQVIMDNDIIVPDSKSDISDILLLDGDVIINNVETLTDKLRINGTIFYKILYICDDAYKSVGSINSKVNFSHTEHVESVRPNMFGRTKCNIEHINSKILNGRKLNIKTIVSLSGKITDENDYNVVSDIRDVDGIQLLKNTYDVNCYIGNSEVTNLIEENLTIPVSKPPIKEILRNDLRITKKDHQIIDGKIISKGIFAVSTLYESDDEENSIHLVEHEIPFTNIINLDDIDQDSKCDVEYKILDSTFDETEDSDGELRIIDAQISLATSVSGYYTKSVEVAEDGYKMNRKFVFDREIFKTHEVIYEQASKLPIRSILNLDDSMPEAAEILSINLTPVMHECRVQDDKIIAEGSVNAGVIYSPANSEFKIFCLKHEIPFKHSIEKKNMNTGASCDISLDIENLAYAMNSGREIELNCTVSANARIINDVSIPLTTKVTEYPAEPTDESKIPSIVLYFCQPDDTLWRISKKYFTPIEEIKAMNNLDDSHTLSTGQQLIIPRHF